MPLRILTLFGLVSMSAVGLPGPIFIAMTLLELGIPLYIMFCQASITNRGVTLVDVHT